MRIQQANKVCLMSLFFLASVAPVPLANAAQAVAPAEAVSANRLIIRVGANRLIKTIAEAARRAKDGDTIEVDAGNYVGDVAIWSKNNITLRAIGGRVRLIANGTSAEGKGIWVVRGEGITVEGFEFSGATVPDHNAAGIRFEKGSLTVRDCIFLNNENGILTSNFPELELKIEDSEFGHNGYGDGQTHDLYVGAIAHLSVTGSYFHHARSGHLLKSRAAMNHIFYNRLTDESGGRASYELEFPNGGIAYVIGNIIQQSSQTENPHLISYGAEDYTWPRNELYLVNNTLVDNRPQGGVFLRIKPGSVTMKAVNNLLVGQGKLDSAGPGDYRNNFTVDWDEFELAAREDYRLKRNSKLLGRAVDADVANGQALMPDREYFHPRKTRQLNGPARHPGALQSLK
ncbi:MAG: right-handed parallel beta-helix repeat-containing protein [Burkholderiaceae bacterium]|nr:right-handed parallel beta-helix repeat-containing protein [Burkholderiaceae bacterium]